MLSSKSSLAVALIFVVTLTDVLPLGSSSRGLVGVPTDGALEDSLLMMERFHGWMAKHGKSYAGVEEKLRRFDIFCRNVEFIEAANRDGRLSYTLGVNQFADLTHEEFLATHTSRRVVPSEEMVITTRAGVVVENANCQRAPNAVPGSISWVNQSKVTPVKNQGKVCGACWAFSAVATIESAYAIAKRGEPPVLSEQELIDCDTFDRGCTSGEMSNAYFWVLRNGGIANSSTYPYKEADGKCERGKLQEHAATIRDYKFVKHNCEEQLMAAVAVRPVAVGFDSNDECFKFYRAGLYDGMCIMHGEYFGPCSSNDRIHSLAIVGYVGKGGDRVKYWIAKNSWGEKWGKEGYVWLKKDVDEPEGLCGLAIQPVYPIV